MPVSYTCPNPDCGVTLKTPNRVAAGKSVKCPKCGRPFVPEPEEAGAGTLKVVGEEAKKPAAPPAAYNPRVVDDEESNESIKKGYGVIKESEAELKEAAKNKPKFTEVQDKFKKSARGPAQALLVMPSNLLTFEGIVTVVAGIVVFILGMWPLVFNDAPPGEEELDEAVAFMLLGVLTFVWGAMICYGASQMQELGSYTWSMIGAIMGIIPLLAGIFALIMLQNPKVKAGFLEAEAGPDEDDEDEDGDDDDDDETADDDDDDDDGGGGSKSAKKVAGRFGRRLLSGILSGEDEEDGGDEDEGEEENEDEEEEDKPKKRRKKT